MPANEKDNRLSVIPSFVPELQQILISGPYLRLGPRSSISVVKHGFNLLAPTPL